MIILDTNVVSEPLKVRPDLNVVAWLDRQVTETLYLTATSLAELKLGIEMLPLGKRKAALRIDLTALIDRLFGSRVLPFEQAAATPYASIISQARTKGKSIGIADGQIAAIASVQKFTVATRDSAPFITAGIRVINPWNE